MGGRGVLELTGGKYRRIFLCTVSIEDKDRYSIGYKKTEKNDELVEGSGISVGLR
jgi:hypothetical protein